MKAQASILRSFRNALDRFAEALAATDDELARDASIQRFEFTYELAWKSIRRQAQLYNQECPFARLAFKVAYGNSWISSETIWIEMLESRNRVAHTYDENYVERLAQRLPIFLAEMEALYTALSDDLAELRAAVEP